MVATKTITKDEERKTITNSEKRKTITKATIQTVSLHASLSTLHASLSHNCLRYTCSSLPSPLCSFSLPMVGKVIPLAMLVLEYLRITTVRLSSCHRWWYSWCFRNYTFRARSSTIYPHPLLRFIWYMRIHFMGWIPQSFPTYLCQIPKSAWRSPDDARCCHHLFPLHCHR